MSTELNKRVASDLFARFTAGDLPGVLDLLTDDATWWIAGKPELTPAAGVYDKRKLAGLFEVMLKRLQHGLAMTVDGAVAEGDKVALEVRSEGDLKNGQRYRQQYHFLMTLRDGKICAVREYLDTQHAHAVWFGERGRVEQA